MLKAFIIFMSIIFIIIFALITFVVTGIKYFLAIVPFMIGSLFTSLAIFTSKKTDYSTWKDGKGKVVGFSTTSYTPGYGNAKSSPRFIIEFMDEEGKIHRGRSQGFKSIGNKYPTGTEFSFKYKLGGNSLGIESLASIKIFNIDLEETNSKLGTIIFLLLGLFFLFSSVLILIS